MRRGGLHVFILERTLTARGKAAPRKAFLSFYGGRDRRPKRKDQVDAVTRALETLIRKGMLTAVCVRTAEKWFIKEVRLTTEGRRATRKLLGEQQELPLKGAVRSR